MRSRKSELEQAELKELYSRMFLIRSLESKLLECHTKGLLKGTVHTCIGQEACAVGIMNAINKDIDVVFSNHRSHGHLIAYEAPLEGVIAEIFGKVTGLCKGIGGTQQMQWKNFYSSGVQGGIVPPAIGAALAEKKKQSSAIVLVFLGDGTMGQGVVYEGFNLSALWELPIIFVLENNCYAQNTPVYLAHAGRLEERADSFGIPTSVADGNDLDEVCRTAAEVVDSVRNKVLPAFFVLNTYRIGPHSKGDDARQEEEIREHLERDPLPRTSSHIPEDEKKEIESHARLLIEETIQEVLGHRDPTIEDFFQDGKSH